MSKRKYGEKIKIEVLDIKKLKKKLILFILKVIHNVLHYIIKTIMERVWLQVMKASHKEFQRLKVV